MSRPVLLALAVGTACAVPGCDLRGGVTAALAAAGTPSFREVAPSEAHRLVEGDGALLLQARGDAPPERLVRGARLVAPGDTLAEASAGRRIVIVSGERALGFRLGARLAREGATGVAVMMGGLPEWEQSNREE